MLHELMRNRGSANVDWISGLPNFVFHLLTYLTLVNIEDTKNIPATNNCTIICTKGSFLLISDIWHLAEATEHKWFNIARALAFFSFFFKMFREL